MSDKNKNRKSRLSEFFRYNRNELSGEERNSFERELQKDPFTEEASEGFKSILDDSAGEDISELERRLKVRTSGRKSFMLYRIAASVAIIIALSSIFIVIEKNRSSKQIAVNTLPPPVLEISRNKPVTQSEVRTMPPKEKDLNEKRKSVSHDVKTESPAAGISEEPKVNPIPEKSENNNLSSRSVEIQKNDSFADLKSESAVSEISEDRISAPAGAMVRDRSLKKVQSEKEESISGHNPPQPVNGKTEFDKYIKENMHRPDSLTAEQNTEVTLSFIVRVDGSLDKIRIVSSPGRLFSDEAIRLIKSGPMWKPAEQSGKPVEERVKVKISFRLSE
jgi:hypothetical protein